MTFEQGDPLKCVICRLNEGQVRVDYQMLREAAQHIKMRTHGQDLTLQAFERDEIGVNKE